MREREREWGAVVVVFVVVAVECERSQWMCDCWARACVVEMARVCLFPWLDHDRQSTNGSAVGLFFLWLWLLLEYNGLLDGTPFDRLFVFDSVEREREREPAGSCCVTSGGSVVLLLSSSRWTSQQRRWLGWILCCVALPCFDRDDARWWVYCCAASRRALMRGSHTSRHACTHAPTHTHNLSFSIFSQSFKAK